MNQKNCMSLSLDLDNKWCYLRTYGNEDWHTFPSYLDLVCPRILAFLDDLNLRITFFIVGKDASLDTNRDAIASLSAAGHEIANHSYFHEPWLHLYSEAEFEADLRKAEDAIESVTGCKVVGFRGPGYSLSKDTLQVLRRRNYDYDATAFPNILNPLSRAYLFATAKLTREERAKRKALFGSFSDALRPVKPYRWRLDEGPLLELPVTTMPVFKTPIHFSYLIYLGMFSETLAKLYLYTAIRMCKLTRTEPSLLLHPLDFMGAEDDKDLARFPGMKLSATRKLELLATFIGILTDNFEPATVGEHIRSIKNGGALKDYSPTFSTRES